MIARFSRWIGRQYSSVDYAPVNTGVMFVCFLPFTVMLLAFDSLPIQIAMPLLIVAGIIGGAAALWAFWLWFKGFGDAERSAKWVERSQNYGKQIDG